MTVLLLDDSGTRCELDDIGTLLQLLPDASLTSAGLIVRLRGDHTIIRGGARMALQWTEGQTGPAIQLVWPENNGYADLTGATNARLRAIKGSGYVAGDAAAWEQTTGITCQQGTALIGSMVIDGDDTHLGALTAGMWVLEAYCVDTDGEKRIQRFNVQVAAGEQPAA